jgi:hypothetical protein
MRHVTIRMDGFWKCIVTQPTWWALLERKHPGHAGFDSLKGRLFLPQEWSIMPS